MVAGFSRLGEPEGEPGDARLVDLVEADLR